MPGSSDESRVLAGLRFVQVGIISGLFTCAAYPLLLFAPLPKRAIFTLAAFFGPALAAASFGFQRLLDLDSVRVWSRLGAVLNALAGALFSAMVLVQLAVGASAAGDKVSRQVVAVWLGLDVAWDAYLGLGTICFSVAMLRHPRFGRAFAVPGLTIAVALLALNLYSFPTPPANAGLVDVGPLVGLWYLAVTLQMWRSLAWARERASATVVGTRT